MAGTYREYIKELDGERRLKIIEKEVNKEFDISKILYDNQDVPILFRKIKGFGGTNVVGNLCPTRQYLSNALKIQEQNLVETVIDAFLKPKKIENILRNGPWIEEKPDLSRLPIPKYYEKDGGPYLTSSIVVSRFPNSEEMNLSIHRIMVNGKTKGVIRILPRHLSRILEEEGGSTEIAVLLGVHPAIFLAAALSADYGISEYWIANALLGGNLELVKAENGLIVPSDSEIVLLGKVDVRMRQREGPFVDITGTYDAIREEPVISFEKMLLSSHKMILQALLPASKEHKLFMGIPQEVKIALNLQKAGIDVRRINLTEGGCAYFHCIISIKKKNNNEGNKVIEEIFRTTHSIKLVIVVDEDVNPYDYEAVDWAIATRFQANRGLTVVHDQRGSSLDPSSFKTGITSKVGIDATLPINIESENFKKARIP
ncbi:MAG: UbiD family decarboxylase [Nitrososphaeria archaeon]